jgi:hypothetical protein
MNVGERSQYCGKNGKWIETIFNFCHVFDLHFFFVLGKYFCEIEREEGAFYLFSV